MIYKNKNLLKQLRRGKRLSEVLFTISTCFGTYLIFFSNKPLYAAIGLFCYLLAIFTLPNINKVKADIAFQGKLEYSVISGEVADFFPKKEGSNDGEWILMITTNSKAIKDYIVDECIDIVAGDKVEIELTKKTGLLASLKKIESGEEYEDEK